jgi:ferredoxin-NADP reductase
MRGVNLQWLDRLTGRFTMYRLVLIGLLAVFVEAVLLALTGSMSGYTSAAIIVCVAVAVATSYLSNRLLALMLRARPHSESSLITGLIIGMLFLPILDGPHVLVIFIAALVASVSKYLLAIRRRHIFNPAALGAFVAGLVFPLDAAGWWVATIWLLPVTAIFAFVILFRTRHLAMGIVFTVLATGFTALVIAGTGQASFLSGVGTALVSFPIVFFVGFMLSEPLTLPPRRWQQLIEAAVVAGLFGVEAIGFHVGPVYASPLIALLIGNLLAFLVGQRGGIRLALVERTRLTPTSWELSFRPRRPVRFQPGQYIELSIPHARADTRGMRRIFSIASAPAGGDIVRIGINTAEPSSSFKKELLTLQPGEIVSATSVGGDFLLPKDPSTPLLFVAGGIGITPFMSHLEHIVAADSGHDVAVIYSASTPDELAYAPRLVEIGIPVNVVSASAPSPLPDGWTYLGRGPLTLEQVTTAISDVATRAAYVSGPPSFVSSIRYILRRAHAKSIHTDYFTGYTKRARARYRGAPVPKEPAQVG